mgnify:CR=1 FL=1
MVPIMCNRDITALRKRLNDTLNEIGWMKGSESKPMQQTPSAKQVRSVRRSPGDAAFPVPVAAAETRDTWMQELAGTEPLHQLAARLPTRSYQGEHLVNRLIHYQVPLLRASWYIKATHLHKKAQSASSSNQVCGDATVHQID